jgi:hypothetical protein
MAGRATGTATAAMTTGGDRKEASTEIDDCEALCTSIILFAE